MSEAQRPHARSQGLVLERLDGEVLLYDQASHRAHGLDRDAARVWEACDGRRTPAQIAQYTGLGEQVVAVTLDRLDALDLLTAPAGRSLSRRSALHTIARSAAGAAIAVPVISTILAPTAAQALSCLGTGSACSSSAQCCSGVCSGSNVCL
jgi:hypothetical protein